jgi:hypothetical protein
VHGRWISAIVVVAVAAVLLAFLRLHVRGELKRERWLSED